MKLYDLAKLCGKKKNTPSAISPSHIFLKTMYWFAFAYKNRYGEYFQLFSTFGTVHEVHDMNHFVLHFKIAHQTQTKNPACIQISRQIVLTISIAAKRQP